MHEKERMQLHGAIESVIREMIAGSTLEFHSREIDGVTVTGKLFPYQTIGITGILQVQNEEGFQTRLVALYQKVAANWYRINFDPTSRQTISATVDIVEKVPKKGLFLTVPIGWVRQKESGLFNYFSSLADVQIENYEHPDLTETVMKLAVVHDAAQKKQHKTGKLFD